MNVLIFSDHGFGSGDGIGVYSSILAQVNRFLGNNVVKVSLTPSDKGTIYGVVNIGESVVNGIFQAWERESVIEFRNVGYLGLPKLALASFSASLGIIGGLAVIIFLHTLLKDTLTIVGGLASP